MDTDDSRKQEEDCDVVDAVMLDRSLLEAKQRAYDDQRHLKRNANEGEPSEAESFLEDLLAVRQGSKDEKQAAGVTKGKQPRPAPRSQQEQQPIEANEGELSEAESFLEDLAAAHRGETIDEKDAVVESTGSSGGKTSQANGTGKPGATAVSGLNVEDKVRNVGGVGAQGGTATNIDDNNMANTSDTVASETEAVSANAADAHGAPIALQRGANVPENRRPGAYSHVPDQGLQRNPTLTVALGTSFPADAPEVTGASGAGQPGDPGVPHNANNVQSHAESEAANNDLVEATPVEEEEQLPVGDMEVAGQVDPEEEQKKVEARRQEQNRFLVGVAILILIGAIVVGVVAGTRGNRKETSPVSSPSPVPSPSPSSEPSASPTSSLDMLLEELPESTRVNLRNSTTPQYRAWQWLSYYRNLILLPEWRKRQLFALATFFYSFEGENWPELVQERWLDDSEDECLWFSGEYGRFNEAGEYIPVESFGIPPCNAEGEYQSLKMGNLQLDGLEAKIPPEIALLTSLTVVGLAYNGIGGPLTNLMPTELFQLTNLTLFNCRTNQLSSTIPTEIGLLKSLTKLWIYQNSFLSPIPSEIGQLTSMKELIISEARLTSTIPTELFMMTNMEGLYVDYNFLTGTLPSEVGYLSRMDVFLGNRNNLTGFVPSEVGLLADMTSFGLYQNFLSGSLPSELGQLVNVNQMSLMHNEFTGLMPLELCPWECKERTSPFPLEGFLGRTTAVSSDDCNCSVGETYPSPNTTNEVVINVQYDGWPEETAFAFEKLKENETWVAKLAVTVDVAWTLVSYRQSSLGLNSLYHFYITDIWGDGICCGGAVSITNGTVPASVVDTPYEGYQGTIVWSFREHDFTDFIDVYLWIDSSGSVSVVSEDEGKDLAGYYGAG